MSDPDCEILLLPRRWSEDEHDTTTTTSIYRPSTDELSSPSSPSSTVTASAPALPHHLDDNPQSRSSSHSNSHSNNSTTMSPTTATTARGSLTALHGLSIVIGLQIGVGIFSIPRDVSAHVPTAGAGVLVWAAAGLLVWTGAACFVELGTALPRNGGMLEYLREAWASEFAGFLFSWTWIAIARPCTMSIIALIFAEHVVGLLGVASDAGAGDAGGGGGGSASWLWLRKAVALMAVWVITLLNCLGAYAGAHMAMGFLVLKISAIVSIIGTGMVIGLLGGGEGVGRSHLGWFGTEASSVVQSYDGGGSVWAMFGEYVTALFAALWVYGGWEAVSSRGSHCRERIPFSKRCVWLLICMCIKR
jgi:L-type amino acid transporter 6